MTYHLAGIGVGPGYPELITLKALRTLQRADIIFTLRNEADGVSVALDVALEYIDEMKQHVIPIDIPRGRRAGAREDVWQKVADTIAGAFAAHSSDNVRGVYLLLGDASLYGTFNYLTAQLNKYHPTIETSLIAGVSAFSDVAARVQLPISSIDERVCILPATYEEDEAKLRRAFQDFHTVILLKIGRVRPQMLALLSELDLLSRAVYAERIGLSDEYITKNLQELDPDATGPYLSLLIVRTT